MGFGVLVSVLPSPNEISFGFVNSALEIFTLKGLLSWFGVVTGGGSFLAVDLGVVRLLSDFIEFGRVVGLRSVLFFGSAPDFCSVFSILDSSEGNFWDNGFSGDLLFEMGFSVGSSGFVESEIIGLLRFRFFASCELITGFFAPRF